MDMETQLKNREFEGLCSSPLKNLLKKHTLKEKKEIIKWQKKYL